MLNVILLDPRAAPDDLGLIPAFLDPEDPRPAAVQLDANYQHGGGWRPQHKFKLNPSDKRIVYPGDPAMAPFAMIPFRDEQIYFYPYGYIAVVQADGSFEAARMD